MSRSVSTPATFAERALPIPLPGPLLAILGVGLVLRLLFIGASGFHNDIAAFEAWTLTLTEHPLNQFYASTTFADYPPGYFFVLLPIGWFYKGLIAAHIVAPGSYGTLGMLTKLPAIVMDLVDATLIYAIVRRFAARTIALGAAALYALNPAAIYVSAYWGQVDSFTWGLILLGMYLLLSSSGDERRGTLKVALAWIVLAASVLAKPQGTFVGFVFFAFVFTAPTPAERQRRIQGTLAGLACGFMLAYLESAAFTGKLNPLTDFAWLLQRYTYGSGYYAYNTVNAFNLYAIKQPFWQSDLQPLTFLGIAFGPMVVWGWALVCGATLLIVARYIQRKDDRAFLEAAMLVSFGFFILATRMHERYIFGAFLLAMPLIAFGRLYLWSAVLVSATLFVNLAYSLNYQTVMEQNIPGANTADLWPLVSHPLAAINVVLFFVLGYVFLGGTVSEVLPRAASTTGAARRGVEAAWWRARTWFDPAEGVARMQRRDWLIAGALTLASFLVCIAFYQWPTEKVFDEIYYARAGEEYLQNKEIFEFTHPPLTKLIVTLSMILFGGLHGLGDTPFGWRFLNIVVGALTVGLVYLFAKRLTSSTLFATLGAAMLLCDGFHFVQSRIATPEITVAFFSLATLYAFYRFWIAAQVSRRIVPVVANERAAFIGTMVAGTLVAAGLAYVAAHWRTPTSSSDDFIGKTMIVAFIYFEAGVYLFARTVLRRFLPSAGEHVAYADGSRLAIHGRTVSGATLDGMALGVKAGTIDDGDAVRTYDKSGALTYTTPAGEATFETDGVMHAGGVRLDSNDARTWLIVLAFAGGAVAASKWNGLFDFFVVWGLAAAVAAQRWLRRPALYGNPFGASPDIVIAAMLVVAGAIYTLCYIPYMSLGHNLVDVVSLQKAMYDYHHNLVATHPYASKWWQWPLLQRPISYYYHDFRTGAGLSSGAACCVAEILALPNPFVWWLGLASVPLVAVLAWLDRNKGYALLVVAYLLQWLPWIGSPRIAFEYHFYPNLAIIVLANAILLQRAWQWGGAAGNGLRRPDGSWNVARLSVATYMLLVVGGFIYFYPVVAGVHIPYDAWRARMWLTSWI